MATFGCQMNAQTAIGDKKKAPPPLYRILQNGRFGYIDSTGTVRIQPIFFNASDFSEGLAAVREKGRFGFIDVHGQYVMPPIYDFAEAFEDGEAMVWVEGEYFKLSHDGARKAFDIKTVRDPLPEEDYSESERLEKEAKSLGFVEITPVYKGRRFARDGKSRWYLTDAKGKKVAQVPFEEVLMVDSGPLLWEQIWQDGLAFVKTQNGIGAIDMDGNFKIPIRAFDFDVRIMCRWGDILVFSEDISTKNVGHNYQYGFWNFRNNLLVSPRFHAIDQWAFLHGGLVAVLEGEQSGYINRKGEYVWREQKTPQKSWSALNIDYMIRGNFYAASPRGKKFDGYGGWGGSSNYAKKIGSNPSFEPGKIQLKVDTAMLKDDSKYHPGFALYLSNATPDTLILEAQDSRLNMYLQALDSTGNWRDIMYLPSSWCGNSYHKVFLAPGEFWDFTVPVMEGEIRTKLRVMLKTMLHEGTEFISNEFEAGINPAQFWRKPGYYSSSIMDPYED